MKRFVLLTILFLLNRKIKITKSEAAFDCRKQMKSAAALSATCCYLTRPSLDQETVVHCYNDTMERFEDKTFTKTEQRAFSVCMQECLYQENGIIDADPPFKINKEFLNTYLESIMPQPKSVSVQFMMQAFEKCYKFHQDHPRRIDIQFPELSITTMTCNNFAIEMMSCVRIYAMQGCPSNFYMDGEECLMAKKYFQTCMVPLTKIV